MKSLFTLPLVLALAACGSDSNSNADAGAKGETPAAHAVESFYLSAPPENAVEVAALRELKDGDKVTVRGDVQEYAPVEGKAVLSLYDHALLSCDEIEGDQCETPWDFCCADDDDIANGSAMVEFRKDGKLVSADLEGFHGIDHLSDVVITGTLHLDDAGNARIVASGVHVE